MSTICIAHYSPVGDISDLTLMVVNVIVVVVVSVLHFIISLKMGIVITYILQYRFNDISGKIFRDLDDYKLSYRHTSTEVNPLKTTDNQVAI